MKWSDFNVLVRDYLLVDSERKGRGIQKYIDKLIKAGCVDLQRYVDQLKVNNVDTFLESELIDTPDGVNSVEAQFAPVHATISQVVVSGYESEDSSVKWYSNVAIVPWSSRFSVINGCPQRTRSYPGKVTFGGGKIYLCSPLIDNQKLYIYWTGEKHDYEDEDYVIFDDVCAKAVADWTKAHLNREVDKDIQLFKSYMDMYNKQRQQIYTNEKLYNVTNVLDRQQDAPDSGVGQFKIS